MSAKHAKVDKPVVWLQTSTGRWLCTDCWPGKTRGSGWRPVRRWRRVHTGIACAGCGRRRGQHINYLTSSWQPPTNLTAMAAAVYNHGD